MSGGKPINPIPSTTRPRPPQPPGQFSRTEFGLGWGRGGSVQPRQQGHMLQVLRKNNGREIGKGINWREETCLLRFYFLFIKLKSEIYFQLISSFKGEGKKPKGSPLLATLISTLFAPVKINK